MKWLNGALKLFPIVMGAINAVETLFKDKHGKDKQDAAIEIITQMIGLVEISFNKELMDQEEFKVLLRKLIDDAVAVQNFIRDFQTKKENQVK